MNRTKMEVIKPGDLVLFNSGDNHGFKTTIGVVYSITPNNNYNILSSYMAVYKDVAATDLVYASDENICKIRKGIINAFNSKISNLQEQAQQVIPIEENKEYLEEYRKLKKKVISVARHILESEDDTDFVDRLKELAALDREFFFLKFNCADRLRIKSTNIQKKIDDYARRRDNILSCIDRKSLRRAKIALGII